MQSIKLLCANPERLGVGAQTKGVAPIISLTSIESRLHIVGITIRSLLNQNVAFERIILWLNDSLLEKTPNSLLKLQCDRFEIKYSQENGPHRKLVETLRICPESCIVTCDDDVIYPRDWLERLLDDHLLYPRDVIAHECRTISYSQSGELLPYKQWRYQSAAEMAQYVLAIGYGGVLYPSQALHEDAVNRDLYDKLAPRVDDLWFKAMSLRQGTATRKSSNNQPKPIPILFSQKIALKHKNVKEDKNREQWQKLEEHYFL